MAVPVLVIFGASGDMVSRLLLPALYQLELMGALPELRLMGYALEPWNDEAFREHIHRSLTRFVGNLDEEAWRRLSGRTSYRSGNLSDASVASLAADIEDSAAFYLALPPSTFGEAAGALGRAGLSSELSGWRRLVIEKPFGSDTASAQQLNEMLHEHWTEEQIYRIDHFLGKETVQNLIVFRFANRVLDPVLNANHVASVQITVAETLGLEGRQRYYEQAGALRDMLQNHLMQLFTLVAMEPPPLWDAEAIKGHKVDVLKAVRPIPRDEASQYAARGRYAAGHVEGRSVPGYLDEQGIPEVSRTETYAAVKFFIDNWRWKGVPFYLRSGKRLASDVSEIAVEFKDPPSMLFRGTPTEATGRNLLIFRIRPDETIELNLFAKEPGLQLTTRDVPFRAAYASRTEAESAPYTQLLLDVINGDRMPFLRFDEVEWAWRVLQPVIDVWREGQPEAYASGSDGPSSANDIVEPGDRWRPLDGSVSVSSPK